MHYPSRDPDACVSFTKINHHRSRDLSQEMLHLGSSQYPTKSLNRRCFSLITIQKLLSEF